VTTLVLSSWASFTSRMRHHRTWKMSTSEQYPSLHDSLRSSPVSSCPQGHILMEFVTPSPGVCDSCNRDTYADQHVMYCRSCDWLLCDTCKLDSLVRSTTELSREHFLAAPPDLSGACSDSELLGVASVRQCHEGSDTWLDKRALNELGTALSNWKAWKQSRSAEGLFLGSSLPQRGDSELEVGSF
jgi:hypothetical protein